MAIFPFHYPGKTIFSLWHIRPLIQTSLTTGGQIKNHVPSQASAHHHFVDHHQELLCRFELCLI
jgi:hypothetical protein